MQKSIFDEVKEKVDNGYTSCINSAPDLKDLESKPYKDSNSFINSISKLKDLITEKYNALMLYVTFIGKLLNGNGTVKFNEESAFDIGSSLYGIWLGISLLFSKNNPNSDVPYPNEDEPGPGGGGPEPGPNGDDSEPDDNDSNKKVDKGKGKAIEEQVPEDIDSNKKIDKGKGKAIEEQVPEEYQYNLTRLDKGKGKAIEEQVPEEQEYYENILDKGKSKAKAATSEELSEIEKNKQEFTDYDEKIFQNDLERAKLNSLKKDIKGESSRDGATLLEREQEQERLDSLREDRGESSTQAASLGPNESAGTERANLGPNESTESQKEVELSYDHFCTASKSRRDLVREFNDITMELNSEDSKLDPEQRQALLNDSIAIKQYVQQMDEYLETLKKFLDIPSDDPGYESSNNEDSTDYSSSSSEEESRPNKRPKK